MLLTGNFPRSIDEKQRVAILLVVVRQPKILIADEPTENLDPKHAWDIVAILEKINRHGTTVLLTTHNQEIVNKLKRRVLTIEKGRVVSDKSVSRYRPKQQASGRQAAGRVVPRATRNKAASPKRIIK